VTIMVDDPQYLALPYIKTYQYKKQPTPPAGPDAVRRALTGRLGVGPLQAALGRLSRPLRLA
jgi:hypothetical protein